MITGVSHAKALEDTAAGWMSFAWASARRAFQELTEYDDALWHEHRILETISEEIVEKRRTKALKSMQFTLNNALSLLQQSLELFLKARITEISPYLLIAGDVSAWPKADAEGNVDFSQFRTIDATHLCRAVNLVSSRRVSDKFVQLYDGLRKQRNVIIHLGTGDGLIEAKSIMLNAMQAQHHLFDGRGWNEFRLHYLEFRSPGDGDDEPPDPAFSDHDQMMYEIEFIIEAFEPRYLKQFIGFDPRKKRLICPFCWSTKGNAYEGGLDFMQRQQDGSFRCCACCTTITDIEGYAKAGELIGEITPIDEIT